MSPSTPLLVGRESELAAVARLLGRADGPGALVLEGETGIGKTAVWLAAVARARDDGACVLASRPGEGESALPWAGLGDLLDLVLDEVADDLPPPQRAALEAALHRTEAVDPVDGLGVSRATLSVLRRLAADGTLVVVAVDDVQWLDGPTAATLAFAARRLEQAPVRLLVARRSDREEPPPLELDRALGRDAVETLRVGPMTVADLDLLLRGHLGLRLARPRLVELHAASGGNPLYGLEIARSALRRGIAFDGDEPLPVPEGLADLLAARLGALSSTGRRACLLAAVSSRPTAELVESAAGGTEGLADAVEQGVLEADGSRLRFSHPLLSSTLVAASTPWERRDAHRALAEAARDREERAHHLAVATDGPDGAVAAELEEASGLASARGAPDAAARLAERAGRLTPASDDDGRGRRLVAAAGHHVAAGDPGRARAILERLAADLGPGPARADLLWRLADTVPELAESVRLCEQALAEADGHPALAAQAHNALGVFTWLAGDLGAAAAHCREAARLAEASGDDRLLAVALGELCHAEVVLGRPLPEADVGRALAIERALGSFPTYQRPSFQLGVSLLYVDRLDAARPLLQTELRRVSDAGDAARLGVLFRIAELELRAGNWAEALRAARECAALARQAGIEQEQATCLLALSLVTAHLGLAEEARDAGETALALADSLGDRIVASRARGALGFLELSLGDASGAHELLGPPWAELRRMGVGEHSIHAVAQNELEALVTLGLQEEAEAVVDELERAGRPLGRAWHLAVAARGRALVAAARGELAAALGAAEEALGHHERLPQPFELGRTLLAKGTIERRAKQRAAARESLRRALELFDALGAPLWAERAAAELARVAGRPIAGGGLTETERRIAELAAEGLANREIAARLFVTVRTVEANLTRVYAKLGVRSRAALASRLVHR